MLIIQNSWGREGGMFVGQTAGIGKAVCWSVEWLG